MGAGPQMLSPARPRPATYLGLGVVTLATLVYEIGLTRIFSATMHYHFAFVAISLALFGMTLGALLVYLRPERFPDDRVRLQLWEYTLGFATSVPICLATQLLLPLHPDWSLVGLSSVLLTCVVISVPFVLSGIVVCLALTRFPEHVNRLYAVDLVRAAIGCIGFVLLLRVFDGSSAVLAIGAIGAFGALCFASDTGGPRKAGVSIVVTVAIVGVAVTNAQLARDGDAFVNVRYAKGDSEQSHFYEDWNNFSRITVWGDSKARGRPFGWGMSPTLPSSLKVRQLGLAIDNDAGTVLTGYDGNDIATNFLRYDITNLAHYAKPDSDVLVIGVGGGRDILSALEFEAQSVTGVEINHDILGLTNGRFADFTGHLYRNPKVRFVNDEARSYVTRGDRRYDLIQISLIDTWAATTAGAFALTENSLYTTEAFQLFFDSLKEEGVLSISRWYSVRGAPPLETYRTVSLAAEALKRAGAANPREHILIYTAPPNVDQRSVATVLISPTPLTERIIDPVARAAARLEFTPILTPEGVQDPVFGALTLPAGPAAAAASFAEDLSPPSDDRPFFFLMANLDTFLSGRALRDDHITRPVQTLGTLGFVVMLLALLCIVLPAHATRRQARTRGMLPFYVYFAGIGLGFLLIEISQLQRLSVFLGHPTYALTVVLFSLLLSSGAGSMLAERFSGASSRSRPLLPLFSLLGVLVVFSLVQPAVIAAFAGATTPVRIATAIAMLAPLGFLMGMPFPIGMRTATTTHEDPPTAFFWGINGAASVCASVMGMVLSLFFGITFAFWLGVAAYLATTLALLVVMRRAGAPSAA